MINSIKKYFYRLWYSLPFAMKAANNEIFGSSDKNGGDMSIHQEVNDQRVGHHLLKGEVTQEVEELRYRTYKVSEESERYQYIGNGISVKEEKEEPKKNIHKFIQDNELLVSSVLEEMQRVGSYGTENYRFEVTYKNFPRFKIEQFAKQVDVYINDKESTIETAFHFNTEPNPYDMKSKPFITEVEKMANVKSKADAERNELASNIETFSFITYKSHGEDNLVTYSFTGGAKFKSFEKTDGDFIVTYSWDEYTRVPSDLSVKYYSKSMAEKYEKKVPKVVEHELVETNRKRYCEMCGKEINAYDGDILESLGEMVICNECLAKANENKIEQIQ